MSRDVSTIDGYIFRSPEEDEKRDLSFLREEGAKLLALHAQINDRNVRDAIIELVKVTARKSD